MNRLLLILVPLMSCLAWGQEVGPGHAVTFRGGSGTVSFLHDPELNAYPLTVTAWVKTSQDTGASGLINKYLSGSFCGWQLYLLNGRVHAWYFADATHHVWGGGDGLDGGPIADGQWHHVAFSVADDGGRLYVDGALRDSLPWSGRPTRTPSLQGLTLGSYPGVGPAFFRGQLDEIRIWNQRQSRTEILAQMNQSLRGDEPGLVAYFRMDEGAGSVVLDGAIHEGFRAGLISGSPSPVWGVSGAPLIPSVATNGLPIIARRVGGPEMEAGLPVELEVLDDSAGWEYQWTWNGEPIQDATGRTFSNALVGPGEYRVIASRGSESRISPVASIRVFAHPVWMTQPTAMLSDAGDAVEFTAQAAGGRPMIYELFHNGVSVASSRSAALTLSPVRFKDAGAYQIGVRSFNGSSTSLVATLRVVALPLTNGLVLHLPFDGNLEDRSGRENHAGYVFSGPNARPTPRFVAGQIGTAFEYTTRQDGSGFEYVTLGYPPDLQLGDTNDFSVSMWVFYRDQGGDLPFLSNKDWDKSHNQGWAIATQNGGTFRVNLTGPRAGMDFVTTASTPVIRTGRWRHLLVSVARARVGETALVSLYVDGRLVNQIPSLLEGTVDTVDLPFRHSSPRPSKQKAWAINIGQDGTGAYFDKGSAYITAARVDDVGLWRRALTSQEAQAIYTAGLSGLDLAHAAIPLRVSVVAADEKVTLIWPGDPSVRLETSLAPGSSSWTDISPVERTNEVTIPTGPGPAYFRLTESR